ncbi:MAG: sigma-70 family RNA polymerase sigma factor, partial [Dehalococcoidia bacterium]|nr:sigma-70 family RNA polymerase sigma factor [Dehalococcoidia bacterium]
MAKFTCPRRLTLWQIKGNIQVAPCACTTCEKVWKNRGSEVRKLGKDIGNDLSVLINRFKAGDEDAFEQIYTRCYGHVAYVCTKLCPNKSDVEEIVQDTFMAVYKMAKDLKSDTFMALLRKIAARQCYRKHKTNQEEYILYGDEIMELAAPDTSSLPEAHLDIKESNEELLRIVHQLPPKQQEVV